MSVENVATEFISVEEHRRIIEAVRHEFRVELGKKGMQLAVYAAELEEAGLPLPDRDGKDLLDLWRTSAAVISTASEFVGVLGTAAELIRPDLVRKT